MSNNEAAKPVLDHDEPMGDYRDELIARLTAEEARLTELLSQRREQTKQLIAEIKQTRGEGDMLRLCAEIVELNEKEVGRELTEIEKKELWERTVELA